MDVQVKSKFKLGVIVLEIVDFFELDEVFISGAVMLERAERLKADLDQKYAGYVLENEDLIPPEWEAHDLVFSKATNEIGGRLSIMYMRYQPSIKHWALRRGWAECDWDIRARLVRSCS